MLFEVLIESIAHVIRKKQDLTLYEVFSFDFYIVIEIFEMYNEIIKNI